MSSPALNSYPAIVIGGGISGLVCAYMLQQAGIAVRVLDAAARPGGMISSIDKNGFLFELGPQSFLSTEPLLKLIGELGLEKELLHADSRAPRYILSKGKLIAAPLAPPSLLTSPLLGSGTKWRIFTEMLHRTQPPANDESIGSFIRRKFGEELLNQLVAPFVSGVYAGDPERLSLRASFPKLHEFEASYGSVLRGAIKSKPAKGTPRPGLCSFRSGMESLPKALAARLGDSYLPETRIDSLRRLDADGRDSLFEIDITRGDQNSTLQTRALIVATPTTAASQLLKGLSAKFEETFARIEYAPVAVIAAGYRRDQLKNAADGFGFLVPRSEGLRVLGTVWNSSLFPGRVPEGMASFTSFAGGATDPELCDWSEDKISETICAEVERVLGISVPPVTCVVQRYRRALPQYNLGHTNTVAELGALASCVPGLFLAGNYLSGPSIGSCVEQADQTAKAACMYLSSTARGTSELNRVVQ